MKKFRIIWTPQAKQDLRTIQSYIAHFAPGPARAFVARIRDRVRKLSTFPHATVPVEELARFDIREVYVGSYRVMFRVEADVVRILTVVHGARHFDDKRMDENI